MTTSMISNKRNVCIITGASKGLGKAVSLCLAKEMSKGSLFILLSRNELALEEVAKKIKETSVDVEAVSAVFDQNSADGDNNKNILHKCLSKSGFTTDQFEQAILIHNAGSLEPLEYVHSLDQLNECSDFFKTNLAGCITLTSSFLQIFNCHGMKRIIINISSLAAISPMKSWVLYCMAKAARDMMMKVVAAEEENMRTLNYAPGPLVTDMTTVASEKTKDPELQKFFKDSIENKSLVQCEDSAKKLLEILKMDSFENGAHIDYFDEI